MQRQARGHEACACLGAAQRLESRPENDRRMPPPSPPQTPPQTPAVPAAAAAIGARLVCCLGLSQLLAWGAMHCLIAVFAQPITAELARRPARGRTHSDAPARPGAGDRRGHGLLSDKASYVTGGVRKVAGGL